MSNLRAILLGCLERSLAIMVCSDYVSSLLTQVERWSWETPRPHLLWAPLDSHSGETTIEVNDAMVPSMNSWRLMADRVFDIGQIACPIQRDYILHVRHLQP